MSSAVHRLANLVMATFLLAGGLLFYWQIVRAGALTADPSINRTRQIATEHFVRRGQIVDRNGVVLASNERRGNEFRRVYTVPSLVHVVGYHSMRFGDSAVEDGFNDYLRGAKGGDPLDFITSRLIGRPPLGNDVALTIDGELQAVADKALGSDTGAIVAIDPRSGQILAMASHPYFDPNTMEDNWDRIRGSAGKPLLNRATQGLYAPGSTFKTITLAAALDAGVTRPDEDFTYPMKRDRDGVWYHDQLVQGFRLYDANHGPTDGDEAVLDLAHAYAESCNIAFADLGLRLGARRLAEGAGRFGFDVRLPIELPSGISRLGPDGIAKGDPALASTAFGQGQIQVTPLQMALVAASVANGGIVPKPFVVASVRNKDGEFWRAQPEPWRRAMTPETAGLVGRMMITSAEEGWAKTARIPGVTVAAKTGTAETGSDDQTHAWLIAYAPAENPIIAVAVIKEFAGGGAAQAGPVAKAVMEAALARAR